jgi:hypothetical protein
MLCGSENDSKSLSEGLAWVVHAIILSDLANKGNHSPRAVARATTAWPSRWLPQVFERWFFSFALARSTNSGERCSDRVPHHHQPPVHVGRRSLATRLASFARSGHEPADQINGRLNVRRREAIFLFNSLIGMPLEVTDRRCRLEFQLQGLRPVVPFQLECPFGHGHNVRLIREVLRQLREERFCRLDHGGVNRRRAVASQFGASVRRESSADWTRSTRLGS